MSVRVIAAVDEDTLPGLADEAAERRQRDKLPRCEQVAMLCHSVNLHAEAECLLR